MPRWYLWDGGFLALGQTEGVVPAHSHHAIQIVLATEGTVAIKPADGEWREGRGIVVRQDAEHLFDGRGMHGAMLFVDPESNEGVWLGSVLSEPVSLIPEAYLRESLAALGLLRTPSLDAFGERSLDAFGERSLDAFGERPRDAFGERPRDGVDVGELIRSCVLSLCAGAPPARRPDERVSKVLAAIRASDDLRMSVDDAAAIAFLSPSRFTHLFSQQVGLPFRRYMLWRKVTRAMLAIGRERTIAAAAQAAGFADAAHLTRTFQQMFGMAPSVMMRGELVEIAPPFG